MIHIFFVPGMFGSMIEMALRAFTDLDGNLEAGINEDGSAHTFKKQIHPVCEADIVGVTPDKKISTPIYPFRSLKLPQILQQFRDRVPCFDSHRKILIYAPDQRWAEINMLFRYHKISKGLGMGLEIFGGETNQHNIRHWNPKFDHWSQMRPWQYREWLSLFYPTWISEWQRSVQQITPDFLTVSNQDIMESTAATLETIVTFCGHNFCKPHDGFCEMYRQKQQYVLDEYHLIENIIDHTINTRAFDWQPISIVGEAILQNRFSEIGWQWRCDGLDDLPTNSFDLADIIYQDRKH